MRTAKVLFLVLVLLLLTVTLPAEAITPIADFTTNDTHGVVPLAVSLTDTSLFRPNGWVWFFGDETYNASWTEVAPDSLWMGRYRLSSVVLPDGSIVLMGGTNYQWSTWFNDTWRSTDKGLTWVRQTAAAEWTPRNSHTSEVLPDGSIVLMGGVENDGTADSDVWRSEDKGVSWTLQTSTPGWFKRYYHSSVVLPDGSIVLMGGANGSAYFNDVWRSTDKGVTWVQQTATAEWPKRFQHTSVALPDGSIVLIGGTGMSGLPIDDVWRSTNNGTTWTQMTPSAGLSGRENTDTVVMPDGSIVLMGGMNYVSGWGRKNDVWRSPDKGATWIRVNASAGWSARYSHTSVALPDGSIVLMGGIGDGDRNDVWRFQPAGSLEQSPVHTYPSTGVYSVSLVASNADGFNSTRKTDFITVNPLGSPDTIGIYKDGSWYIDMNGNGVWDAGDQNFGFGAPDWIPVVGDWNHDGLSEIGVYRDGAWYLDYDTTGWWSAYDRNYGYGAPNWTPVVGDWNGDGSDKIGAYKDGAWYIDYDGSGTWNVGDKNFAFGAAGWEPVVGKWSGNMTRIGVYKDGVYYIDSSGDWAYGAGDKTIVYGTTGSIAIIGDWNANDLTEVGTKTGKEWKLDYDGSGTIDASTRSYTFGAAGWNPVIGDWNGYESDKIGIYLNGAWYLDDNGNGVWDAGTDKNYAFGTTGWIPVVGKWI